MGGVAVIGRLDRWQRRHTSAGFLVAVIKKFSDDGAAALAALISYYAFIAAFPLLLVVVTIGEIVLRGHPALLDEVVESALSEFPVIGDQWRENVNSLHGSATTVAIGLVVALIGARGVAVTLQRVCNKLWGVAYVDRPTFVRSALRTLAILVLIGVGLLSGAVVVAVVNGLRPGPGAQFASLFFSFLVSAALFLGIFRIATAPQIPTRDIVRSAVASAAVWQLLLGLGTVLVDNQLRHASALYGVFGVVLGLLAWFVVQATATLYAIEADVVRARGLWPRGLREPMTAADEKALAAYALGQRRDARQAIDIRFD